MVAEGWTVVVQGKSTAMTIVIATIHRHRHHPAIGYDHRHRHHPSLPAAVDRDHRRRAEVRTVQTSTTTTRVDRVHDRWTDHGHDC